MTWSKIKLLTVQINRRTIVLRRIALHRRLCATQCHQQAVVGINLAIQDAVATANLLAEKLQHGPVHLGRLANSAGAP